MRGRPAGRSVVIFTLISRFVVAIGVMSLALALVGVYALVAYAVGRRTKEIGIRMAIGADGACVLRMVLRHGMAVALAGLGVGLAASLGAAVVLGTLVPGGLQSGGGIDATAFVFVGVTVMLVTVLATFIPASRAARIDPMVALRCD